MLKITDETEDTITLEASGKISREDYEQILPALGEKLEKSQGNLNMLMDVEDFEGLELDAIKEGLSFNMEHLDQFDRFDRVAVLGGGSLEALASKAAEPFTGGEVKQFDSGERASAHQWVAG